MSATQIESGTHVEWEGKSGMVDLVVSSGAVPGVEGEVTGTADEPVARVVVGEEKVAVPVSALTVTDPAYQYKTATEALVGLLAEHGRKAEGKGASASLSPEAVQTAYERGLHSWPGEGVTSLSQDEWAVGRVGMLSKAATAPEDVADSGFADGDLLDPTNTAHTKPSTAKPTLPVLDFTGQDPEDPEGDYPAQPGDAAAPEDGDDGPDGSPDADPNSTTVTADQLHEILGEFEEAADTGDSAGKTAVTGADET